MRLFQYKPNQNTSHFDTVAMHMWNERSIFDYAFYYHSLDSVFNHCTFSECISEYQIKFLQKNSKKIIIYDFAGEAVAYEQLLELVNAANAFCLNDEQIVVRTIDQLQTEFLKNNIPNNVINQFRFVEHNPYYEFQILPALKQKSKAKFSVLSRRHTVWRSYFFSEMHRKHYLRDCVFSYHGIKDNTVASVDKICKDILLHTGQECSRDFFERMPYTIDSDADYGIFYSGIPQPIMNTDIHIVLEHSTFDEAAEYGATFISEKTYKAIAAKKPFLAVSDPGFLLSLENLGFKTFSPYIPQDYDTIENHKDRVNRIIEIIKELRELPQHKFEKLLQDIQPIVDYNYDLLQQKAQSQPSLENLLFESCKQS